MLSIVIFAFAIFASPTSGQVPTIRLADSSDAESGRLEIMHDDVWGTVCDDMFDNVDVQVVCYMLGYGRGGVMLNNQYGPGTGNIWMDNVDCLGNETSLADCGQAGWGVHNCEHSEDVSISCIDPVKVRLVGGASTREGRLEVQYDDVWGTVCDDSFDNADAAVICYMLGYGRIGQPYHNSAGAGTGQIWLNETGCVGHETTMSACQHGAFGSYDCEHTKDVWINCSGVASGPTEVRLVGGTSDRSGRLEVMYNGVWGTVCDDEFSDVDAQVACYMLGYGRQNATVIEHSEPGVGIIWLDEMGCTGSENSLASCSRNEWGIHDCTHPEDVYISCDV